MDFGIKKDLTSNWFKTLQEAICYDIANLEGNKIQFTSNTWQRSKINDEVKLTEELYMQASCAEIGVFIRLLNIGHTQMVENFTSFLLETIPKFAAVTLM